MAIKVFFSWDENNTFYVPIQIGECIKVGRVDLSNPIDKLRKLTKPVKCLVKSHCSSPGPLMTEEHASESKLSKRQQKRNKSLMNRYDGLAVKPRSLCLLMMRSWGKSGEIFTRKRFYSRFKNKQKWVLSGDSKALYGITKLMSLILAKCRQLIVSALW